MQETPSVETKENLEETRKVEEKPEEKVDTVEAKDDSNNNNNLIEENKERVEIGGDIPIHITDPEKDVLNATDTISAKKRKQDSIENNNTNNNAIILDTEEKSTKLARIVSTPTKNKESTDKKEKVTTPKDTTPKDKTPKTPTKTPKEKPAKEKTTKTEKTPKSKTTFTRDNLPPGWTVKSVPRQNNSSHGTVLF